MKAKDYAQKYALRFDSAITEADKANVLADMLQELTQDGFALNGQRYGDDHTMKLPVVREIRDKARAIASALNKVTVRYHLVENWFDLAFPDATDAVKKHDALQRAMARKRR